MELRGAVALITGAAGGLGAHIARDLAAEGASLVISDLPGEALDRRTDELRRAGIAVETVAADLRDPGERERLVDRAEESGGPIDVLVNNAGVELTAPFLDFTQEELDLVMEVNLVAPMDLIRRVVPGMLERGRGHVVNLASLAGKISPAYMASYGLTKAGLIALTQTLRAEHADDPVGFSAVCPGFVAGKGMVEVMVESKTRFPAATPLSPPELVSKAVVRSIERDLPDVVIVHRRPIRLVLALNALAPRLTERLLFRTGTAHTFEATTRARGRL